MFASIFAFPSLAVLIGLAFFAVLSWRLIALRYFFIGLFGLGQLFYLVNIAMFMANIDLIRI